MKNTLSQARFSISGPKPVNGQGASFSDSGFPPGTYTITYGAVPFYTTPAPQTLTLSVGGTLLFEGRYGITDSNGNEIADSWELHYFGTVGPHPSTLDTDLDGMSDLGEFLAGTDPTQASSVLRLLPVVVHPSGTVDVSWSSVADRGYRLMSSTDLSQWSPVGDWVNGRPGSTSAKLPNDEASERLFLRVEVRP